MAVVGAPSYFAKRSKPQRPHALAEHSCINLRLRTNGGLYAWEFAKGRPRSEDARGRSAAFNNVPIILRTARQTDLAWLASWKIRPRPIYLAEGTLVRVLGDWCAPFSGYHLYYPSRRQSSAAFACSSMRCDIASRQAPDKPDCRRVPAPTPPNLIDGFPKASGLWRGSRGSALASLASLKNPPTCPGDHRRKSALPPRRRSAPPHPAVGEGRARGRLRRRRACGGVPGSGGPLCRHRDRPRAAEIAATRMDAVANVDVEADPFRNT